MLPVRTPVAVGESGLEGSLHCLAWLQVFARLEEGMCIITWHLAKAGLLTGVPLFAFGGLKHHLFGLFTVSLGRDDALMNFVISMIDYCFPRLVS